MSATMVFGFFALANGNRVETFRGGSSTATYHCIYETTIQCTSGAIFPAMLRVYSPFNDVALPDNTVAFVSAKVSIPASIPGDPVLLEGIWVVAVPGDPNSDNYEHSIPDFPYPMVVGLGTVDAPARTLADGTSKAFTVTSIDYVRDTRTSSTVCCVFDSARPRWRKTPLPNQNTVVFYVGRFSDAAPTGGLQVELESITLNVGVVNARSGVGAPVSLVSKKRKFMAGVAPKDGERGGILSEVGGGDEVPSSPTTSFVNDHCEVATTMARFPDHPPMRFVDAIGDGGGPEVPISLLHKVSSTDELIEFVFPDEILAQPHQCLKRAILCPTDSQIDSYNTRILQRLHGDTRTYFAADSLMEAEDAGLLPSQSILDYVAQRTPPGLPPHSLRIHVGGIYRLVRDFSLYQGLAKDCRVVITSVGQRIIAVKTLQTENAPYDTEDVLIPRITFNAVLFSGHTLLRRQFPLAPAYATTTDSCQGLTLDAVGIDLTKRAFSHS